MKAAPRSETSRLPSSVEIRNPAALLAISPGSRRKTLSRSAFQGALTAGRSRVGRAQHDGPVLSREAVRALEKGPGRRERFLRGLSQRERGVRMLAPRD